MKINIYNYQKDLRFSKPLIKKMVKEVLNFENVNCDELSLYFVNEKIICELHEKYFGDSSSTDCITFPIDNPKEKKACFLGEVFICPKTAINYAQKHSLEPLNELYLYIIHGLLHLLGYDDISKKDKTIMRKKEKSCMSLIKEKKLETPSKFIKQK